MNIKRGFTLIELLVVLAIISILLAVIRPMLSASASRSREFECESNLKQIGMALHSYAEDYGAFPKRLESIDMILQDKNLLRCPKTDRTYYYKSPVNIDSSYGAVSCINPESKALWPHRYGECYLSLTAKGSVIRVQK